MPRGMINNLYYRKTTLLSAGSHYKRYEEESMN